MDSTLRQRKKIEQRIALGVALALTAVTVAYVWRRYAHSHEDLFVSLPILSLVLAIVLGWPAYHITRNALALPSFKFVLRRRARRERY